MTFKEKLLFSVAPWRPWWRYGATFFLISALCLLYYCVCGQRTYYILFPKVSLAEIIIPEAQHETYFAQELSFFSTLTAADVIAECIRHAHEHMLTVISCGMGHALRKDYYQKTSATMVVEGNFFAVVDFLQSLSVFHNSICRRCDITRVNDTVVRAACTFSFYTPL